jgi:hypothetical protein
VDIVVDIIEVNAEITVAAEITVSVLPICTTIFRLSIWIVTKFLRTSS